MTENTKRRSKIKYEYFRGKSKWAKIKYPDSEYKQWNMWLYLDTPSRSKFLELKEEKNGVEGLLNELKMDDDGYYIVLRRPMSRNWNGKETMLTPPLVIDKDNKPFDGEVGNGSDVTVKVELYSYNKPFKKGRGLAMRLNSIRVEELVPFGRSQMAKAQDDMIDGFDAQSGEQLF